MAAVLERSPCRLARSTPNWLRFQVPLGQGAMQLHALFIDFPVDLIAKTSHLPGIQLGYLTTLFELALAVPWLLVNDHSGAVAAARAAAGDFLSVTEQHRHSPLQSQQDYSLLKWLTGHFIKVWNMSQSERRLLRGSLSITSELLIERERERWRDGESDGPKGPQTLHQQPTFWPVRSFKCI